MTDLRRTSTVITGKDVAIETYIDGQGPCLVILPSYGRDGGEDYDNITGQLTANGWQVVRPQPRGIAGSTGPMIDQSLHDLAGDVALCIRSLCQHPVVLLGHAFGNVLARVVTTDHPDLVKAVVLAAAEASKVPEDVGKTPFIASDTALPEEQRLAALRKHSLTGPIIFPKKRSTIRLAIAAAACTSATYSELPRSAASACAQALHATPRPRRPASPYVPTSPSLRRTFLMLVHTAYPHTAQLRSARPCSKSVSR